MDHIEGVLMSLVDIVQSTINVIKANQEKYYSYITGYKNPRETVLNYLICEDLRNSFPDLFIDTDIKLKIDDKNRFIDIILYKNDTPSVYLLIRREYGKNNAPIEKDTRKVKYLTSKNANTLGIVTCFLNPPSKEIRYVVFENGVKIIPSDDSEFSTI
jgi:hypothetical protein